MRRSPNARSRMNKSLQFFLEMRKQVSNKQWHLSWFTVVIPDRSCWETTLYGSATQNQLRSQTQPDFWSGVASPCTPWSDYMCRTLTASCKQHCDVRSKLWIGYSYFWRVFEGPLFNKASITFKMYKAYEGETQHLFAQSDSSRAFPGAAPWGSVHRRHPTSSTAVLSDSRANVAVQEVRARWDTPAGRCLIMEF